MGFQIHHGLLTLQLFLVSTQDGGFKWDESYNMCWNARLVMNYNKRASTFHCTQQGIIIPNQEMRGYAVRHPSIEEESVTRIDSILFLSPVGGHSSSQPSTTFQVL